MAFRAEASIPRARIGDGLTIAALAVAALFAAPLGYLVVRNAGSRGQFWAAVTSARTLAPLGRSFLLAFAVSVAATVVGTGAAWLVARCDIAGRRFWEAVLPLPLVVPSFIAAFAMLAAFNPGGLVPEALGVAGRELRGFSGAFVVLTLLTYPYVFMPASARLAGLPPSIEEAAQLLGRRRAQVFATVVWPQIRGAALGGGLLAFLYVVSDFGAVQLLRYDTLTRAIYGTRLLDPPVSLALSLELGILAMLVVGAERTILGRTRPTSGKAAARSLRVRLGPWRVPATLLLGALAGLALAAPLGVLGYWAVRGIAGGVTLGAAGLVRPALNTTGIGLVTAVVSVAAVAPVAFLTVRRRSRAGEVANALIIGSFALPGLPLALALVFWTVRAPGLIGGLYQTLPLLVFAYLVHFGAMSLRTSQEAVAAVPRKLDEAARSLGSGRARRLLTVDLPIMAPGLVAAAGLVGLSTMKELPATLLLAPAGFQTLATKVWGAAEEAFFAQASLAALVLVGLSGLLTWIFVVRRHGTQAEPPPVPPAS